jgi:RluA family pseudouridine synthase
VKLGTFQEAATLPIRHFRDFPTAVASLPPEWKERTVVTFCTGGIRCEKAAPLLQQQGFRDVYQLSGGILKYFEECGPAHYDGTCFVFDQRVGLDATLAETSASYCFACLAPLTDHDRADPRYEPERSCPHCFVPPEVVREKTLAERAALLARITAVLPGSVPADNYRPLRVPARCAGFTVLEFLFNLFPQIAHETWLEIVSRGHITSVARQSVTAEQIVQPGERYYHVTPGQIEPDVNNQVRFIHEDEALIVVAKPAPLPVHPCGRYERNTLTHWLEQVYAPQQPRPVHRLDANTTGLLVLARTRRYASLVQPQFARGEVVKTYLALVHGAPLADHFHCHAPISQSAGPVGARALDPAGLPAHTEFFVRERRTDGTTLLEAIPHTGRTNQIRLHLWSLGHPIVGDQLFLPDLCTGTTQTASLLDSPLCLHAWKLKLCHPITGETVLFQCQSPSW